MSYIGQWMHVPIKPGIRDEVIKVMHLALERTWDEEGTCLFVVNTSDIDPNVVLVYEMYRDEDAMAEHAAGDWLSSYVAKLEPYLAGAPVMHTVRPVLAKGI